MPSGPGAISVGSLLGVGIVYWVRTPVVVILATELFPYSVNQRFPSGPRTMYSGWLPRGVEYSVKTPRVVTLAILSAVLSVT